ncbi:type II secretion system protein [Desulfuromonas sp.]|uniref:type II secretion system protein n=1 Tax=Desulfuromonas sp. TaxID=892 RepID=UPI0025C2D166|nr:type II secretion system protein [Desulfuromonas sp.]
MSVWKGNQKGFTLVELLIVVIILAVLAAIVVPQFGSSTAEAKEAALRSTITEMRNAIELYYHQHRASYPGAKASSGAGDGTGAAGTEAAFTEQLIYYSNADGATNKTRTPVFKYGPYLKKQDLPVNPIDDLQTLTLLKTGDVGVGSLASTGDGTTGGWWVDTVSGKFIANTNDGTTDYRTW